MNTTPKKVSQNFLSISGSQIIGLLLNLISFAIIARYLSVEKFGTFSLLLAVVGILSKIIDFGLSPIVFRENSSTTRISNLLQNAISIRLVIFAIVIILANLFFLLRNYSLYHILLFNLLMLSIIISAKSANIRDLLIIPFKVNLQMLFPSLLAIIDSIIFLTFVIVMTWIKGDLLFLILIYVFSNLPGFLILIYALYKKFDFRFKFIFDKAKWLILESLPLTGFVLLMSIYQQIDIILLKSLSDDYATGIFASAIRLVQPLNLIPNALVTTIFPILVRKEIDKNVLMESVYKLLFFISFILSIVFLFKSEELINLVFGMKYVKADISASILFISQIFMFLNFFSLSVFTAERNQKNNFKYALILVLVNFILDILLIPKFSFLGAAISKGIASLIGFVYTIPLLIKSELKLKVLKKNYFFWLVSVIGIIYFLSKFNLIFYLLGSSILIVIITIFTGYFNKKEIRYFIQFIK